MTFLYLNIEIKSEFVLPYHFMITKFVKSPLTRYRRRCRQHIIFVIFTGRAAFSYITTSIVGLSDARSLAILLICHV